MRHGRTGDNAGGRIQGQVDTPLDDVGREQAALAAPHVADASPDLLLSSDLSRASATARVLGAACALPARLDPRLRELDLGRWQGLTSEQARVAFPQEHADWRAGIDTPRGGGETYREAGARAVACLLEALVDVPPGGLLVAVTHGGTTRGVLGTLLQTPHEQWWRYGPLANTACAVLAEHPRGWRLERHNAGAESLSAPVLSTVSSGAADAQAPDVEPVG